MLSSCLIIGKTSFEFDDNCKSYLLDLNSSSLIIPKSSKEPLRLVRQYLLLQIFFYPSKQFTLELETSDSEGIKRRIIITQTKYIIRNIMHARLPNTSIERNIWLNLYINIFSLFSMCFPMRTFRSLDAIFLNATCKLRRIYSISEENISYLLPSGFDLPRNIGIKNDAYSSESLRRCNSLKNSINSLYQANTKTNSLPLIMKNKKKNNIFIDKTFKNHLQGIDNNINELVKEDIEEIIPGSKKYLRKNLGKLSINDLKQKNDEILRNKLRKITHNHYNNENLGENIEENILIEESPLKNISIIDNLQGYDDYQEKNEKKDTFDTPDYFSASLKEALQLRHVTPPFVYVDGSCVYNPIKKQYEQV